MPANLPPIYYEIEKKLKFAQSPEEKIQIIMQMIAVMPKHKGTDHLQAELRRKISLLKKEASKTPKVQRADLYTVPKEGAGQIVLIGKTNSGKSTILANLTNAKPMIGEYPFTTQKPEVGMVRFENVNIQLVDTPPLCFEHRPPWLLAVARSSDALAIILTPEKTMETLYEILLILEEGNMFVGRNKKSPREELMPKMGFIILNMFNGYEDVKKEIEREYPERFEVLKFELNKENLEIRRKMFEYLDIIRVYTKPPGKEPELTHPVILKKGDTVEDAAEEIHKDFAEKLRFARLWRKDIKGMMVKRDFILEDGDIIEFHIQK
uniref:TGS domain-containing protein n=1 Tax=candidate division WOR-3 bacterium TaxID=2052148 RepID=A0A7C4U8A9_UNCW3